MDFWIPFLFVLGLITVIGHGIWVLLAAIFRAISGGPKPQSIIDSDKSAARAPRDAHCAECGAVMLAADSFCPVCGRSRASVGPMADLATTARQLHKFLSQGQLDAETHNRVMQVIEEARAQLLTPDRPNAVEALPETPSQPVAPAPIAADRLRDDSEADSTRTAPAVIEQNVFALESAAERADEREDAGPVEVAVAASAASSAGDAVLYQPRHRRSFSEMLETFMEESSIRWGELIGGLLIIGCSIALVVNLWAEIAARPFLKFSVLIGVTAALFGLGFYSAHRWNLPTTSRGVLIISTLLAPLNFLAMTAFSRETVPASFLVAGGELFSLALFFFLVYQAAKVFAPAAPWMTALATMGPSFAMLLARHSSGAREGTLRAVLLGVAPLLSYCASCGVTLRKQAIRARQDKEDDGDDLWAGQPLTHLGVASFATLLPLGLFFIKPGHISQTLRQFAPLAGVFGIPAIATGLVSLQVAGEKQSGGMRTAATSVVLIGSLISLAALIFAWPNATAVICSALINCAVCLAIALASSSQSLRYDLRLAHIGVVAHLSLAFLVVVNLISHNVLSWSEDGLRLAGAFVSRTSGVALISLFALFALASEWWYKKERKIEASIYGVASVAVAAFSLAIITLRDFGLAGDPYHATPVYAFYTLAAFVIAWRREESIAAWVGNALLLRTVLQLLAFKFRPELAPYHPVRLSLLVFANLTIVAAVIVSIKSERARKLFAEPFTISALIASLVVAPLLIFEGWMTTGQISARMLWLAAIWLVIAWLRIWPALFAAFQLALASSLIFAVAALFHHKMPDLFIGDLTTLQAQAIALALLSLAWIGVRLAFRRFGEKLGLTSETGESQNGETEASTRLFNPGVANKLFYPGWPGVDHVITLLLLVFLVGLSLYGVHAGMIEGFQPWRALSTETRNSAATAAGAGSWGLLLALSLVFIAGLWERFEKRAALAMLILSACACLMVAGRWQEIGQYAGLTPAVYRWTSAIMFAAVSSLVILRARLAPALRRFGWPRFDERSVGLAALLRYSSLALFVAPALVFTLIGFLAAISTTNSTHSSAARAGAVAMLIGPVLLIAISFIALAARERSAGFACAAGALLNFSVTLGYLLALAQAKVWIDRPDIYTVVQLNIIATSICSLVWIGFHRRQAPLGSTWPGSEVFLKIQTGMALFSALSLLVVADARLFIDPWISSDLAGSFGGVAGLMAVALSLLAYARVSEIKLDRLRAEQFVACLLVIGSLLVCLVSRFAGDGWIAYRALAIMLNAVAWLALAVRWLAVNQSRGQDENLVESRDSRSGLAAAVAHIGNQRVLENSVTALALMAGMTTLRGVSSPGEPWGTAGYSISICLLFAGLSLVGRKRGYIYLAAAALNYAASRICFWMTPGTRGETAQIPDFLAVNTVVLALPSIAWLAMDLKLLRGNAAGSVIPFHRIAARISLGLLTIILFFHWLLVNRATNDASLDRLALASVAALFVACLWDESNGYALRGLYWVGLITGGMALLSFDLSAQVSKVSLVVMLSLYTLATGVLWRCRESLARLATRLRMPLNDGDLSRSPSWLNASNILLGVLAYVFALVIVLKFESVPQRLIAATVSIVIPISMALLAGGSRNRYLITACVWMALLSATLWGWAWLAPAAESRVIGRLVIMMVIAEALLVIYKFIIRRNLADENEWRQGVKAQLPIVAAGGLTALVVTLSAEALNYVSLGGAMMPWLVVIAVFVALISLFCACIAFALAPGEDPFDLSERGRMNYVYAAEFLTIVTLLHTRLTLPWLFGGFFLTWWPLVVMLLAFTGVGLGELFRRRDKLVLAEPLERTGILLPLLPVIGFWVVNSNVSYSSLLFLVGLFYAILSVMRRSFAFGILAVFAGNGGLWDLLNGVEGYGFFQHPQLWLIPVSLSVLAAARVNRDRLTDDQMTMIRYAALTMIYVSSTSDIFINGVSESPGLTLALAVLSVMGVAAGIALQIRAFLFLGTAFLLLSVLTLIWAASVNLNWGWLWPLAGILFGMLILFTAVLFQKKRDEMLKLVEQLKQWQA